MFNDWRDLHGNVLKDFLRYLNSYTHNYILKGGTSLMLCYNLSRFSEDIDLDALNTKQGIEPIVKKFCGINNYNYRVAKDTDTVKRYIIHYSESNKPLKIEISYRRRVIDPTEYCMINGFTVYKIESILGFKINAYNGRDKIRDLYDIVFICKNYWGSVSPLLRAQVADALTYKGLEHIDYLLKTQSDDLINKQVLENNALELFNDLNIL